MFLESTQIKKKYQKLYEKGIKTKGLAFLEGNAF